MGGPEAGAWVGFTAGLATDLFLPTPFGLSALVGCVLGFVTGRVLQSLPDPGPLDRPGGRGRRKRRRGHAVRRARRRARTGADVARRSWCSGWRGGGHQRRAGAACPSPHGVGARGGRPSSGAGPQRWELGGDEAVSSSPDPRRPSLPEAGQGALALLADAPGRASPGCDRARASTCASLVASPEDAAVAPVRPPQRDRGDRAAAVRGHGAPALDAADHRPQELQRRRDGQRGPGGVCARTAR